MQVGKPGADAVITGDMIHSPLQARYPELGMMADYNFKQAGVSRRELFGRFCETSTLMCTAHFPSPSTGRLVRWRDAFDFAGGVSGPDTVKVLVGLGERGDATIAAIIRNMCCDRTAPLRSLATPGRKSAVVYWVGTTSLAGLADPHNKIRQQTLMTDVAASCGGRRCLRQ